MISKIKQNDQFTLFCWRCANGGRLRSLASVERLSLGISDLGNTGLNAQDCGNIIGEELALKLAFVAKTTTKLVTKTKLNHN
jgi:hypothetical protein